jgi:membrane protease YdiL (CAAX protease family)
MEYIKELIIVFIVWLIVLSGVLVYSFRQWLKKIEKRILEVEEAKKLWWQLSVCGFYVFMIGISLAILYRLDEVPQKNELDLKEFFNTIFEQILMVLPILLLFMVRKESMLSLWGLGLKNVGLGFKEALKWIIPLYIVISLFQFGLTQLFPKWFEGDQAAVEMANMANAPVQKIMMFILAGLIAPVIEEIVFRGFFYETLKRFLPIGFSALWVGIFFGIVHMHIGNLLALTVLGVAFSIVYERSKTLWSSIFLHGIFNTLQLMILFFVKMKG